MPFMRRLTAVSFGLLLVSACVSSAPGADKVRLTQDADDVSNCTALGHLGVARGGSGQIDVIGAKAEFRDQTVDLGGNTALVTSAPLGVPAEGVAYRCP
jgi:hypothetical protein